MKPRVAEFRHLLISFLTMILEPARLHRIWPADSFFIEELVPGSRGSAKKADCRVTPERLFTCLSPTSRSRRRSARTCSRCRIPRTCCRPRRPVSPVARRSTARSTIRPTSSPPPASTLAPATSATCSTASVTACRSCRPPTPASPRCRSLSIPPSRSPTRRCSSPRATAPRRTSISPVHPPLRVRRPQPTSTPVRSPEVPLHSRTPRAPMLRLRSVRRPLPTIPRAMRRPSSRSTTSTRRCPTPVSTCRSR